MYKNLFGFVVTVLVFLSLNVFPTPGAGLVFAGEDWKTETPAQHGLDEKKLAALITAIKKKGHFPRRPQPAGYPQWRSGLGNLFLRVEG